MIKSAESNFVLRCLFAVVDVLVAVVGAVVGAALVVAAGFELAGVAGVAGVAVDDALGTWSASSKRFNCNARRVSSKTQGTQVIRPSSSR